MAHNQTFLVKYQSGFTLTELVLAIILVAIISVTVIPIFFSSQIFEQDVFEKQLAISLAYAQNIAVGSGCHISITNTTSDITLNLRSGCTSGSFTNMVQDPANVSVAFVKTVPSDVTITSSNFPIYFDQNGQGRRISNGRTTNASLTITGPDKTTTITIRGRTGRIIFS